MLSRARSIRFGTSRCSRPKRRARGGTTSGNAGSIWSERCGANLLAAAGLRRRWSSTSDAAMATICLGSQTTRGAPLYGQVDLQYGAAHARPGLAPSATLLLADILDYPAGDAAFDLVLFHHVIEHILDDTAALATVRRILKPGGLLVLGTPNEGCWWWLR